MDYYQSHLKPNDIENLELTGFLENGCPKLLLNGKKIHFGHLMDYYSNYVYEPSLEEEKKLLEKDIEIAFANFLASKGLDIRRQVLCEFGTADIITRNEIFEIKRFITFGETRHAVSQLLAYQKAINSNAKLYIVGEENKKHTTKCLEYVKHFGISLIRYNVETGKFSKIGG